MVVKEQLLRHFLVGVSVAKHQQSKQRVISLGKTKEAIVQSYFACDLSSCKHIMNRREGDIEYVIFKVYIWRFRKGAFLRGNTKLEEARFFHAF